MVKNLDAIKIYEIAESVNTAVDRNKNFHPERRAYRSYFPVCNAQLFFFSPP